MSRMHRPSSSRAFPIKAAASSLITTLPTSRAASRFSTCREEARSALWRCCSSQRRRPTRALASSSKPSSRVQVHPCSAIQLRARSGRRVHSSSLAVHPPRNSRARRLRIPASQALLTYSSCRTEGRLPRITPRRSASSARRQSRCGGWTSRSYASCRLSKRRGCDHDPAGGAQ